MSNVDSDPVLIPDEMGDAGIGPEASLLDQGGSDAGSDVGADAMLEDATPADATTLADATLVDATLVDAVRDVSARDVHLDATVGDSEGTRDADIEPDAGVDARVDAREDADAALDAALDAGADAVSDAGVFAAEGTPCPVLSATQSQQCGICGTQTRACLDDAPVGQVWHAWGACLNELANGCVPGTQVSTECGLCGELVRICQSNCSYGAASCHEPAASVCTPGEREFEPGLSCAGDEGRYHVCRSRDAGALGCSYGVWSGCTTGLPPEDRLAIPLGAAVGQVVSGDYVMSAPSRTSRTLEVGSGLDQMQACPRLLKSTQTRYSHVAITNGTARAAIVSIWSSPASTPDAGATLDTIMGVYLRDTIPSVDLARMKCTGYTNDECTRPPCAPTGGFAGLTTGVSLDGGEDAAPNGASTIPAGGTLIVYIGMSSTHTGEASFKLSARVEELH